MAVTKTFRLFQANGTADTGQAANLTFRVSPYSSDIAGIVFTEDANSLGIYTASNITAYYQDAKLYKSASLVASFGIQDIGDPSLNFVELTGNQTVAGVKTFSSAPKSSAAATATTELIRWDEAVRLADSQVVTGTKVFQTGNLPQTQNDRTYSSDRQLTDVEHVNYLINQAVANQFQESVNKVRVFPDGVEITGQVYLNTVDASASFASPADSNRCLVEITGMGASLNYINGDTGTLVSYVNYAGTGHHIWLALVETSKSAYIKFENMTVVLGNYGGAATARSYTNFEFHNCMVYHYNNVTLTAPIIRDSVFLGSSTNKITLAGACYLINASFNNTITDGGTGVRIYNDNFTWNPPTDPTTP